MKNKFFQNKSTNEDNGIVLCFLKIPSVSGMFGDGWILIFPLHSGCWNVLLKKIWLHTDEVGKKKEEPFQMIMDVMFWQYMETL